jgi:hypothetical protein
MILFSTKFNYSGNYTCYIGSKLVNRTIIKIENKDENISKLTSSPYSIFTTIQSYFLSSYPITSTLPVSSTRLTTLEYNKSNNLNTPFSSVLTKMLSYFKTTTTTTTATTITKKIELEKNKDIIDDRILIDDDVLNKLYEMITEWNIEYEKYKKSMKYFETYCTNETGY